MRKNQTIHSISFEAGQRIGTWTIVSGEIEFVPDKPGGRNRAMIRVRCDCGYEKLHRPPSLQKRLTLCFRCSRIKKGENNSSWKGIGNLSGLEYSRIKRQAKNRGIHFSVSKLYLWDLYINQNGKCALSGLPIDLVKESYMSRTQEQTASLDRIDNDIGYVEGNVQWVHKDINIMKNKHSQEYFIKMCKLVAEGVRV